MEGNHRHTESLLGRLYCIQNLWSRRVRSQSCGNGHTYSFNLYSFDCIPLRIWTGKKKRLILIGWFTSPLRRTAFDFFFFLFFFINSLFSFQWDVRNVIVDAFSLFPLFFSNCVVDLAENRNRAHDQHRECVRVQLLTNHSADRHAERVKHLRLNSPFGHSLLLFIAFPFFLIWFCTFDWYYFSNRLNFPYIRGGNSRPTVLNERERVVSMINLFSIYPWLRTHRHSDRFNYVRQERETKSEKR